jgi:hypothetical protein
VTELVNVRFIKSRKDASREMYTIDLPRKSINEFLTADDLDSYLLPSVQRDFVWEEDEVLELIDSLLRGYPTGVVTVLETNLNFPSVPLIDTDGQTREEDSKPKRYILDGHQRLTSLLLMRDGWKIKREGKDIAIEPIMYNPDDGQLRVKGKREWGRDFSQLVRWTLHKEPPSTIIPRLQKTLEEINKGFLVRPLGFYTVTVTQDEQNKDKIFSDMAEIFTRINRAGIKLGNLEMFLSFFASEAIGKREVTAMYERMKTAHNLDLEPIIRLVFSDFDRTQSQISRVATFKNSAAYVKEHYSSDQILQSISKDGKSIEVIMTLLRDKLGISDVDILPSQTSLVPLFKFAYKKGYESVDEIPENEIKKILRWLILTSFNGLYSSQTDKRLEDDLKIVAASDGFPVSQLLDSMKQKNFRTEIQEQDFKNIDFNIMRGNAGKRFLFILYILLYRKGATDWAGNPISKDFKSLARHHILPKENEVVRKTLEDEVLRNHLGNLTYIAAGKNNDIEDADPAEYLAQMNTDALKEHFIPTDKKLWEPAGYEEFISVRMDKLWRALAEFMTSLS